MLQTAPRTRRPRLARITDDPGFARVLGRLLTDAHDPALPTSADLDRAAQVASTDLAAATRLQRAAALAHPALSPLDALIARAARRMRTQAAQYRGGALTAAAWMRTQLAAIKAAQIAAALLAAGGRAALTPARLALVTQLIRQQYGYALLFLEDILAGRQRPNGRLDARAALYAHAAWATSQAIKRRIATETGMRYEYNRLGLSESCRMCLAQEALGWVPLGTLRPIGTRSCLANCRCDLVFDVARPVTGPLPHARALSRGAP